MLKDKLRLLVWPDCNRRCTGCCNAQWNLDVLPVVLDFTGYKEIIITGGEPMLEPYKIISLVSFIRKQNKDAKIYMYTAKTDDVLAVSHLLSIMDGITVTLHNDQDKMDFAGLMGFLSTKNHVTRGKSLRLNVFEDVMFWGFMFRTALERGWHVKKGITWIEDCPLPSGEVFARLPHGWKDMP